MDKRYHKARFSEIELGKSSGGFPQFTIRFNVVASDHYEEDQRLTMWLTINTQNSKSVERAVETLKTLGMTNNDIMSPEGLESGPDITLVEVWDTYNGEGRWKVRWVNPIKGRATPKLESDELEDFRALMMNALS